MKTFLKFTALSAVLLILAITSVSCEDREQECPCKVQMALVRPENLPPIDWQNYNSVYTVFQVYHRLMEWNPWMFEDEGRSIKAYGWLDPIDWRFQYRSFYLRQKSALQDGDLPRLPVVIGNLDVISFLMTKISVVDLTRKVFVRGTLVLPGRLVISVAPPYCGGTLIVPEIRIYNVDDIYFE